MNETKYPEIVNQMIKHNESLEDLTKLLGLNYKSQASRRLSGKVEWSIGDVEVLCKHYNIDFYKLFKRKEA